LRWAGILVTKCDWDLCYYKYGVSLLFSRWNYLWMTSASLKCYLYLSSGVCVLYHQFNYWQSNSAWTIYKTVV